VAGVHPERVTGGAHPDRGLVLTGTVAAGRPAGAGWEAELAVGGEVITCWLPERLGQAGDQLMVTAVDPPWFGPDGAAVEPPVKSPVPPGTANPEQVGR
jgi:hypothetical protein